MRKTDIVIRMAESRDIPRAAELAQRVFHHDVAPTFSADGVREFLRFADARSMADRLARGPSFILVAEEASDADASAAASEAGSSVVGMIEVRRPDHISLFFVASRRQRAGIGTRLFDAARSRLLGTNGALPALSMNASPNAVGAYERLGFCATSEEKEVHGIRFVPMRLPGET